MIGVPLTGGKTLNVTFRSLNTRFDVFKTYNPKTTHNSPPSSDKQTPNSLSIALNALSSHA